MYDMVLNRGIAWWRFDAFTWMANGRGFYATLILFGSQRDRNAMLHVLIQRII